MNMEIQYTDTSHVLKILTILIKMMMVRLSKKSNKRKNESCTYNPKSCKEKKYLWKIR